MMRAPGISSRLATTTTNPHTHSVHILPWHSPHCVCVRVSLTCCCTSFFQTARGALRSSSSWLATVHNTAAETISGVGHGPASTSASTVMMLCHSLRA